jgi:hypothetical protein
MKLDHINICTSDLEGVKGVFERVLELEVGDRPPFSFPGYWLWSEGHPVVHLTERPDDPGDTTGAINHFAFCSNDYAALIARLESEELDFYNRVVPGSGIRQVFFRINHQILIEVDFDPV